MVKKASKNSKFCALCRNYNNGWGAMSLKVEGIHFVSFDFSEVQICSLNGIKRSAWHSCGNFISRF